MNKLQNDIISEISKQYRKMGFLSNSNENNELPLFLSGGVDSTLCGLVADSIGLKPVCISFARQGVRSKDFIQAQKTCNLMGWKFHPVELPEEHPKDAFFRMIQNYGVDKKTELEVLYPFTFLIEEVKKLGFSKVVFGQITTVDSKNRIFEIRRSVEDFWHRVLTTNTPSPATKKIVQVYKDEGITVCCPMEGKAFKKLFVGLTRDDINKPVGKAVYKYCFPESFEKLGMWKVGNTPLQKGGSISNFFGPLVEDDEINPIINGKRKYKIFSADLVKYHFDLHATEGSVGSLAHRRWVENAVSNPAMNYHQAKREIEQEIGTQSHEMKPVSDTSNLSLNYSKPKNEVQQEYGFKPYTLKDVLDASRKKRFTVVSTFAGGGGSSTGYRLAGGEILAINEFVEEACNTYKANYPDAFLDSSDIRKITRSKLDGCLAWFESFGVKQGQLDILDGSPPCATFSKATGKRLEERERHLATDKVYSDTNQDRIGMLIHDYVYLCNVIKPKICILENVPEIKSSSVFHDALKRLRGHGYKVQFKLLNAHNFGVPQSRERTFVIGVRNDVADKIGIAEEIDVKSLFPLGSSYHPTVKDALSDLILDEQDEREIKLIRQHIRKSSTYEIIRLLRHNPPKWWRLQDHDKGFKNYYFNLKRCAWHLPSPTIAQSSNQLGARGGILHPEEDRTYTVNEMKRLFALPDDFKLTGNFNQRQERVGRMVCPPVTKAIGERLYEKVFSKYSDMSLEQ